MKRQTQLKANEQGVIKGVGVLACSEGIECIVISKNLRSLVRVWSNVNPGTPLDATRVTKVEIRRA